MKHKISFAVAVALLMLSGQGSFAAETNGAATDLNALITKVNAKLQQGQVTEKNLAGELKEFDVLYAKYKATQPEDAVQILNMKAKLYLDVLQEPEEAAAAFQQIKHDRPETAAQVDEILDSLKPFVAAEKIRKTLVVGASFPAFDEKDLAGKPLALANYKGKVVLVDFWATWCVPCRMELPNVQKAYKDYHAKGFEIVGVSLDVDQPTLERFIKENDMTWPEYFDGKRYDNKLAAKYGVMGIPSNYLIDGDGKIIGVSLRGDELATAVAKALAGK